MVRAGRKGAVDPSSECMLSCGSTLMSSFEMVEDSSGIPAVELSTALMQQTNAEQTPKTSSCYLCPSHYIWQQWQQQA